MILFYVIMSVITLAVVTTQWFPEEWEISTRKEKFIICLLAFGYAIFWPALYLALLIEGLSD